MESAIKRSCANIGRPYRLIVLFMNFFLPGSFAVSLFGSKSGLAQNFLLLFFRPNVHLFSRFCCNECFIIFRCGNMHGLSSNSKYYRLWFPWEWSLSPYMEIRFLSWILSVSLLHMSAALCSFFFAYRRWFEQQQLNNTIFMDFLSYFVVVFL